MNGKNRRGVIRGHMLRARRAFHENLKLVDVVLEIVDARLPQSSRHPTLARWASPKPVMLVLNKIDLADPTVTPGWIKYFKALKQPVVTVNARTGEGCRELLRVVKELRTRRGSGPRPLRLLAAGLPNVGKSSLLNRLAGSRRARTGASPGITRGEQWIRVGADMQLLDLPGILAPTLEEPASAWRLLVAGMVGPADVPVEEAALELTRFLLAQYPDRLSDRYGIELPPGIDDGAHANPGLEVMEAVGRRRGCLLSGGDIDWHRTAQLLIEEVRRGLLGRISFEEPPTL